MKNVFKILRSVIISQHFRSSTRSIAMRLRYELIDVDVLHFTQI